MSKAEMQSKPLAFMLLGKGQVQEFYGMSEAQKGYFLHWYRSNQKVERDWNWMIRRAKERRP